MGCDECCVCKRPFQTRRPPQLLPCGHTFCRPCIRQMTGYDNTLKCTKCKRHFMPHEVPKMLELLPQGASCLYHVASVSGVPIWVASTIDDLGEDAKTYCIVLSETGQRLTQVKIESLRAPSSGSTWERGTAVEYESTSTGLWLPAVVISFNESSKTYNLDIHEHAAPDRIRPRMKHRSEYDNLRGQRRDKNLGTRLNFHGPSPLIESCHTSAAASAASIASIVSTHKAGCHCCGAGVYSSPCKSSWWFASWIPWWHGCLHSKVEDMPVKLVDSIRDKTRESVDEDILDLLDSPKTQARERSISPSDATGLRLPSIESSCDWAPLAQGTICLVSASVEGGEPIWERASIERFNKDDQSYGILKIISGQREAGVGAKRIRAQAKEVPWKPGTAVEYYSNSLGTWLPASIVCVNKNKKTYKLNIRDYAEPSRIRPRLNNSDRSARPSVGKAKVATRANESRSAPSPVSNTSSRPSPSCPANALVEL